MSLENRNDVIGSADCKDELIRSGILFGGLVSDIRRKLPWYTSDFIDDEFLQCLGASLFLYFVALLPIISFGSILGVVTYNHMDTLQTIMSVSICGIVYALFAGQPLVILRPSGTLLLFELLILNFCNSMMFDYLEFRFWVGFWMTIILVLMVAFDVSVFASYATRFTQEIYLTIFAVTYIFGAVEAVGDGFIWLLFFVVTILLASIFRLLRLIPHDIGTCLSDFAIALTVFAMILARLLVGTDVNMLTFPSDFNPNATWHNRGWIVSVISKNPTFSIFLAIPPALLGSISIFITQLVTTALVNRKEFCQRKGAGYHLDLFVMAVLTLLCSFFGCPWLTAAPVESMTHVLSLQRPSSDGVREQRLSSLLASVMLGISPLVAPLLNTIPGPVLYGVITYMSLMVLAKTELLHRLAGFCAPWNFYTEYRNTNVKMWKITLFTATQIVCILVLWGLRSFQSTSSFFLVGLAWPIGIRKLLEMVFTETEILAVDDALPTSKSRADGLQDIINRAQNFGTVKPGVDKRSGEREILLKPLPVEDCDEKIDLEGDSKRENVE